ncbi:MAG: hypothetical protein HOH04_17295 [Rhodospirillaceae bacterium]|nr:hypothetical protein [Rhodospirillaceae bacterium]
MSEQTTTRARHQAVLDAAKKHLNAGDTNAYWKTISDISPRYAKIAGQVANDEGIVGTGARERLQDAAEEQLGRRFTEKELSQIEIEIATGDHQARRQNMAKDGTAGLSLGDTDRYHGRVFDRRQLPPDTYTLHNVIKSLGPVAHAMRDTDDPKDPATKARLEKALEKHEPSLDERLRNGLANAGDGLSFISDVIEGYGHDFKDWTEGRQREIREIFQDKPNQKPGAPKSKLEPMDQEELVADLTQQDSPLEDILDKSPTDLTESDVRQVMLARRNASTDVEREKLFGIEKAFFDDKYGAEKATHTAVGGPMKDQLLGLARELAQPKPGESSRDIIKAMQAGLNVVNRHRIDRTPGRKPTPASPMFSELKDDGIAGPKTRGAFKATARVLGPAKVKEGMALGRFKRFAEQPSFSNLRSKTESAFGGLFRKPSALQSKSTEEGFGLQAAINDLGRDELGTSFKPIREDGDIGPKTRAAFEQVVPASGPGRFTAKLGENLGFFNDDPFG